MRLHVETEAVFGRTIVTVRTREWVLRFSVPFALNNVDGMQPPGDYAIECDEDLIEGLSRLAYRRTATFIHLPPLASRKSKARTVRVEPEEISSGEMIPVDRSGNPDLNDNQRNSP